MGREMMMDDENLNITNRALRYMGAVSGRVSGHNVQLNNVPKGVPAWFEEAVNLPFRAPQIAPKWREIFEFKNQTAESAALGVALGAAYGQSLTMQARDDLDTWRQAYISAFKLPSHFFYSDAEIAERRAEKLSLLGTTPTRSNPMERTTVIANLQTRIAQMIHMLKESEEQRLEYQARADRQQKTSDSHKAALTDIRSSLKKLLPPAKEARKSAKRKAK